MVTADWPDDVRGVDPVVGDVGGDPAVLAEPLPPADDERRLLLVAPAELEGVARRALSAATVAVEAVVGGPDALAPALREAADVDAALVVVHPDRPFARCPGPLRDGTPVGLIRAAHAAGLRTAVTTERSAPVRAVLAMGTADYLDPADRLRERLADGAPAGIAVADWRASRVSRPGLCRRLAGGPALAVYHGHGRAGGLSGYQALRWHHVAAVPQRRPIGALVALSCDTLAGDPAGRPFAERFVAAGRAGAALGAVRSVDVAAVDALSRRLGRLLVRGDPTTVGELLLCLNRRLERAGRSELLEPYRLAGLPTRRLR